MPKKKVPEIKKKPTSAPLPSGDPTLPTIDITVQGSVYRMCLDIATMIEAEEYFMGKGHNADLLGCLWNPSLAIACAFFALAIHRFHPEMPFYAAKTLLAGDLEALITVCAEIPKLLRSSLPKAKAGDKAPSDPPEGVR